MKCFEHKSTNGWEKIISSRFSKPSRLKRFITSIILISLCSCVAIEPAETAGPWRAQIVDSESGQPLEGVVVIAVWIRARSGGDMEIGFGRRGYYDHQEIVSDAAGRIVIPMRFFANPPLFYGIKGPELIVFKGSYGPWRFRTGQEHLSAANGATIEMKALRSVQDRIAYIQRRWREKDTIQGWSRGSQDGPENPRDIPHGEMPRYVAAVDHERLLLGLPRLYFGFPSVIAEEMP